MFYFVVRAGTLARFAAVLGGGASVVALLKFGIDLWEKRSRETP